MNENVNFPIGNIVLLDKIEKDYGFFDFMFKGIGGKAKNFQETVKRISKNQIVSKHLIHNNYI